MTLVVEISQSAIEQLDLSPLGKVIDNSYQEGKINTLEQQISFKINYNLEANDPRELSEVPEIRLWFIACDSLYPWLPFCLNWREGELARYTAMLVPHQFHRSEGIQYNQEALDIWIMAKTFTLYRWLKQNNLTTNSRLKAMAQIFGYDLDDSFFNSLS